MNKGERAAKLLGKRKKINKHDSESKNETNREWFLVAFIEAFNGGVVQLARSVVWERGMRPLIQFSGMASRVTRRVAKHLSIHGWTCQWVGWHRTTQFNLHLMRVSRKEWPVGKSLTLSWSFAARSPLPAFVYSCDRIRNTLTHYYSISCQTNVYSIILWSHT